MTVLTPPDWIEASFERREGWLDRIDYEDTDRYQVTRNFLNRRETMLDVLLAPD